MCLKTPARNLSLLDTLKLRLLHKCLPSRPTRSLASSSAFRSPAFVANFNSMDSRMYRPIIAKGLLAGNPTESLTADPLCCGEESQQNASTGTWQLANCNS